MKTAANDILQRMSVEFSATLTAATQLHAEGGSDYAVAELLTRAQLIVDAIQEIGMLGLASYPEESVAQLQLQVHALVHLLFRQSAEHRSVLSGAGL